LGRPRAYDDLGASQLLDQVVSAHVVGVCVTGDQESKEKITKKKKKKIKKIMSQT